MAQSDTKSRTAATPVGASRSPEELSAGFQSPSELVLELDDKPSVLIGVLSGFQHILAIFVPIMTPALLVGNMFNLPLSMTSYLISMSLICSGLGTLLQSTLFKGKLGTGLLSVVGTSFTYIPVLLFTFTMYHETLSSENIIAIMAGLTLVGGLLQIVLSRMTFIFRRLFPPLVNGVILALVGLSLCKVGMTDICGGFAAKYNGTFATFQNFGLGLLVLFIIVLLNCSKRPLIRTSAVLVGLVVGYAVSCALGLIDFGRLNAVEPVSVPVPFKYGMGFAVTPFILMLICVMLIAAEASGDVSATSVLSRQPIEGPVFLRRVSGGLFISGLTCVISGVINSFPVSLYSQNNGVIQVTGVASRHIGKYVGGILLLLGIFPVVGGALSIMPPSVLGGATILMFAMVAAAGIKIIAMQKLDRRAMLILALSMGVGIGTEMVPDLAINLPSLLKGIAGSPISSGGFMAILANLLIPSLKSA